MEVLLHQLLRLAFLIIHHGTEIHACYCRILESFIKSTESLDTLDLPPIKGCGTSFGIQSALTGLGGQHRGAEPDHTRCDRLAGPQRSWA